MSNPTQINQGGAQNQERQDPGNTGGNRAPGKANGGTNYAGTEAGGEVRGASGATRTATLQDQGIRKDQHGQEQPADKKRAQQGSRGRDNGAQDDITEGGQMSNMEKAEGEMPRANPNQHPARKKTGEF